MDIINLLYLIVGSIYGLLLFLRPRIATYVLILLCIFQFGWFSRYFGNTDYLGRIIYFFAMLSGTRIFVDFITQKIAINKNDNVSKSILIFIFGLSALILSSNIYNHESIVLGFYELRYYFIMAVLFFGMHYYRVLKFSVKAFIKGLVIIGLLQIPFAIIQFALAGGGTFRTLDSVTGTFSGYPPLVLATILSIGLLLNYKLKTNKDLFKVNSYYLLFLLIIPLLLSKSRTGTGLVLFMIVIVFILASFSKKTKVNSIKTIALMVLLTLTTGFLFYNFFWKPNYDIKSQFSIDYVVSYYMREPTARGTEESRAMGRARAVYEASKLISKNPITILLGLGGGSVSEADFLGAHGRYYFDFGPLVGVGRTQESKIIAENGIIGVFLFSFLLYSIWKNIQRIKINKEILVSCSIITFIVFFIMSFYMAVFQSPLSALILSYFFKLVQDQSKKQAKIGPEHEKTRHYQPTAVRVSY